VYRFLNNDRLLNLTFLLIVGLGLYAYFSMPREEDPSVNLNWVLVSTRLPEATATDVEQRVTRVIEQGVERVSNIRFISSTSRDEVSSLLIRFDEIESSVFDKRVTDLRREIQSIGSQLPEGVDEPEIFEINSANAIPAVTVLVTGVADDENLQEQTRLIRQDIERIQGVERIDSYGTREPELQVQFDAERLLGLEINPTNVADTVAAYFTDVTAGTLTQGDQRRPIRLSGTDQNQEFLANIPIPAPVGEVPLRSIAEIVRTNKKASSLVKFTGQPSIMLAVYKEADANVLEIADSIGKFAEQKNSFVESTGVEIQILDDRTDLIRSVLRVMENNALIGLLLVLAMTWLCLGLRLAFYTCIGIPFVLAGVFWILYLTGQSLNVTVLLGVVISIGMLVDDAVIVVEAIYQRLRREMSPLHSVIDAIKETFVPVSASVLTTIAAFLPLMLLDGILGDFMKVVPIVVIIALLVSLVEAYWMLPGHVLMTTSRTRNYHRRSIRDSELLRRRLIRRLEHRYTRMVLVCVRRPLLIIVGAFALFALAGLALVNGAVRTDFFASDTMRIFYVNVDMPNSTTIEKTLEVTEEIERTLQSEIREDELRAKASYAGVQFSETEPVVGDNHGQILISLKPLKKGGRGVEEIIDSLQPAVASIAGPNRTSFLMRSKGPPTFSPISIKVRGNDYDQVRAVTNLLRTELTALAGVRNVSDNASDREVVLKARLNPEVITRLGVNPIDVGRMLRLFADGEVVADVPDQGRRVDLRVIASQQEISDIDEFLQNTVSLPDGGDIALDHLVNQTSERDLTIINHYNLQRAISLEADIDNALTSVPEINQKMTEIWDEKYQAQFPRISLVYAGEYDDISDSLNSMLNLFLFGIGLIYLILSSVFRSYIKPLLVLFAVPMAFTGVIAGLYVSDNPLSLYTLYGIIALAGIAVNASIVLISAAKDRLNRGFEPMSAAVYAARRRVLPVLITTVTTISGLFSLAFGIGGSSLMWGPVAMAIISGLAVSTLLTLFFIPVLLAWLLQFE